MAISVPSEGLQNIFELYKIKNNKIKARRGQTSSKIERKNIKPRLLPNPISFSFLTYFRRFKKKSRC
jgi:hypothetical protein